MRILDLGCGKRRYPGSVGVDINPHSNADVIADLDRVPYPFASGAFDLVYCDGIIEHLTDIAKIMGELHRICRPGATVVIITPYFTAVDAFTDPTHKHYFSARSFDYFTGDFPEYAYYAPGVRFRKTRVEISFWALPRLGGLKPQHLFGMHILARRFTSVYERFFAYVFPAQTIRFTLEVMK